MELNSQMLTELNRLKRDIFNELINIVGRVFIVVRYHDDVIIGNRGFLPEEREKGLVLVFNKRMNFSFEPWGIDAKLLFGTKIEHCKIPVEHIVGIYSPELNCQFFAMPQEAAVKTASSEKKEPPGQERPTTEGNSKVVKIDFRKSK